MSASRRLRPVVGGALAVALLVGGCTKQDTLEEDVIGWLDATANLSNRYVYTENFAGQEVVVRGLVEDDFRFKARLTLNDRDVLDEVVNDDALAVRFLDPTLLPQFVKSDSSGAAAPLEVLQQRKWVIDKSGAPPVGLNSTDEKIAGVDPVVDSLATLVYARQAITEARGVVKFNPESVDYRPQEDPFPTPKDGSGIERYDLVAPQFPQAEAVSRTANADAAFPNIEHFRKMSLYVKDKRIIQIRERIAAEGKVLEKFREYMERTATQAGPQVEKQVKDIVKSFEGPRQAQLLLVALNAALEQSGRNPIRFRTMTYELRDLGADVEVGLPSGTEGKLTFFGVNAVQASEAEQAAADRNRSGASPAGATPTAP